MFGKFFKKGIPVMLCVAALYGQKATIETSAEPTTITIGDYITYRVEITHEPRIAIAWPGAAAELGQFQIVDFEAADPVVLKDGREKEVIKYFISTYDVGEWTIPPTAIAYYDSVEDTTFVLRTEPIKITVKSLLSDEDWKRIKAITEADTTLAGKEKQIAAGRAVQMAKEKLLRDITAPRKLERDKLFWIGIAVVALLLAGLIVGFIWWRKRRGIPGSIFSFSAPPLPPHELALSEIAALVAKDYISTGQFKKFYTRLADIVREYIENRVGVSALELSTSETMENLRKSNFPLREDDLDIVKSTLERCDLVKFAKVVPPDDWHVETIDMARDFIERTKPEEPQPEESQSDESPEAQNEGGSPQDVEADGKEVE